MTRLVYTENVHQLALPATHKFPLGKYDVLQAQLEASFPGQLLLGAMASLSDLALVHDSAYIRDVVDGTLSTSAVRRLGFPWSPSLVLRSRRSVGGTLTALSWAMHHGGAGHMAGGTHHAFRDRGEGFCVFNDLAVAIAVARRDFGIRRAAVLDLDVHQGNGTAAMFAADANVFTLSLHGARNYPFAKEVSSLDCALPDSCDDAEYLTTLDAALEHVRKFRPELLLYQAGVDGLQGDRLGRMALSLAGLRRRDLRVYAFARDLSVPIVATLGGGYHRDIHQSIRAHHHVFEALMYAYANTGRHETLEGHVAGG
jgi:acetoin utilization deacetylase AcuC-like enzyme